MGLQVSTDLGDLEVGDNAVTFGARLGEGFFGTVYRGWLLGTPVAIKTLRPENIADDQMEELRREIDILSDLRHPNVLRLMKVSTLDHSNMFLVTELLDLGDLYGCMTDPAVSDKTTVNLLMQCALGCLYLHSLDPPLLHRDLKPPNLLIDATYRLVIADFGLSIRAADTTGDAHMGTVCYMAPEVCSGGAHSLASDVFAFGVVLFEWLWLRDHFHSAPGFCDEDIIDADDPAYLHIHDRVTRSPPQPPDCPFWWHPLLRQLLHDCLQADPAARPTFDGILQACGEDSELARSYSLLSLPRHPLLLPFSALLSSSYSFVFHRHHHFALPIIIIIIILRSSHHIRAGLPPATRGSCSGTAPFHG